MIHVIFHVDEVAKWFLTLGNISNLIADCRSRETDYMIEVVANSEAVKAYVTADNAGAMEHLSKQGVDFVACNNALTAFKISPPALFSFVRIVPAGITELILKQTDGFAYVKP